MAVIAPTNKAVGVVEEMLREQPGLKNLNFSTVHSLLGLKQQTDYETGRISFKADPYNPSQIGQYKLVITDESSMLNRELYEHLHQAPKILFVGDMAQLPPVGERYSPIFTDDSIPEKYRANLSEVVRYGSTIGDLALQIRSDLSNAPSAGSSIALTIRAVSVLRQDDWLKPSSRPSSKREAGD